MPYALQLPIFHDAVRFQLSIFIYAVCFAIAYIHWCRLLCNCLYSLMPYAWQLPKFIDAVCLEIAYIH